LSDTRPQIEDGGAAGSPLRGEPDFLAVGRLRRPHGVRGDILMEVLTDFPDRLTDGMILYVGAEHRPLRMLHQRNYREARIVTFEGYETPEEIGEFRNQYVFIPTADLPPLPEGEYYHHQILGLQVFNETGTSLGTLVEILETGANDVYVLRQENAADILLPAIDPVILDIDLNKGEMRVHLLPGLIEE
jgi:16S rRNA processing protein RimM